MKANIVLLVLLFTININSQNFTKISKQEFDNHSFGNLSYLKEDLKSIKIIGLGEATHAGGGTYTAKIKMVKFLHEKCGFNVLAFEAPMYNLSKVNKQLKNKTATVKLLKSEISGVWNTTEMIALFEYVIETQKTDNPLEYIGFDESFFESKTLTKDYAKFISKLENVSAQKIKLDTLFYKAINKTVHNCYYFSKIEPQDTTLMFNKFNNINKALNKINYKSNSYLYYWSLITNNLQSVYRKNYHKSHRDKVMANNVSFLVKNKYSNKKIILWAATTHLLPKTNSIIGFKTYNKKPVMGTYLKKEFGEKYYLISFSPMQGKLGFKGNLGLAQKKVKSKKGSIERYISENYNSDFAFVPLRKQNVRKEIIDNSLTKSNLIWLGGKYNGEIMNLLEVSDAIFYLKNEYLINSKERYNKN